MDCSYVMARRTLDKDHPRSEQMHPDEFPSSSSNPAAVDRTGSHSTHPRADATGIDDEEVLTYHEAALLLKVSARTIERWTREGLVPYIRLPQRGRWSGVRFSRNQRLRWLRQRTVRER
jgi:excisionase family DNA binding protein